MDGDDFSRSFADALFAAVPGLRDACVENGLMLIDLEPGPARQDCEFWVSTDDAGITVGFGMFHIHFGWPVRDDAWPGDPIKFIQSVKANEPLIEDWPLSMASGAAPTPWGLPRSRTSRA